MADSPDAPSATHNPIPDSPLSLAADTEAEERGRLKRRRQSTLSPRRASSPSRGHDRRSGSRYREHYRKHHRPSSPSSSISPPTTIQKKTRRRSDAEPDHTFRGRARTRSESRRRTRSPILEGDDSREEFLRTLRKRSQPPSRPRVEQEDENAELRRQRSHHAMYKEKRSEHPLQEVVNSRTEQIV